MPLGKYHAFTGSLLAISTSLTAAVLMHSITTSLIGISTAATISFFFTFAGAVAPDVDHSKSYVFRFVKAVSVLITGSTIIFLQYQGWAIIQGISEFMIKYSTIQSVSPTQLSLIICLIVLIALTGSVLEIIETIQPKHRGITHKIWANMIFGILIFPVLYFGFQGTVLGSEPGLFAGIASISWMIGAALHRLVDFLFTCA